MNWFVFLFQFAFLVFSNQQFAESERVVDIPRTEKEFYDLTSFKNSSTIGCHTFSSLLKK
jgi:hypothetical protein